MKQIALTFLMPLGASSTSQATVALVQDSFDDNSLDASKWTTATTGIPQGSAAVNETGGVVQLVNRGHLNTLNHFQPGAPGIGELTITGEWRFDSSIDVMAVLTRSDGTPNPGQGFGETSFGLKFQTRADDGVVLISTRTNGSSNILAQSVIGALTGLTTTTLDFVIKDDGFNVSYSMTDQSDPSNTAMVSTTEGTAFASNLVTFHNRELLLGTNISYLDNVSIQSSVPEPSAALLISAAGVFAIALRGWPHFRHWQSA
jgi:hypothetical protein